jgi:hypothetical protein
VPPTGNIEDDWGPGPADSPYRIQLMVTSTQIRNLRAAYTFLMGGSVTGEPAQASRYRVQLFTVVTNLGNYQHLAGYSGVSTSPFFGQPTQAVNLRKLDFGFNVRF